jgi:hypothetical protein
MSSCTVALTQKKLYVNGYMVFTCCIWFFFFSVVVIISQLLRKLKFVVLEVEKVKLLTNKTFFFIY